MTTLGLSMRKVVYTANWCGSLIPPLFPKIAISRSNVSNHSSSGMPDQISGPN
jgi:hypothetical protein